MCKLQNKPQPVRKNTKDMSTKLNCWLNLKPKEGIVRARRFLRLVHTKQLQQQVCRVPAGRLLVQHQHLLKAGCRNGALQPETTQEMKQPALACAIQCHLTSQRYHQWSRWARSSSKGRWTTSSPIHHPHPGCIYELLWLGWGYLRSTGSNWTRWWLYERKHEEKRLRMWWSNSLLCVVELFHI